ncbi:tyrosine-type recombinase/integrase [Candidatus Poribacteria bacterium]|nr:tyrosine-type recombinase/integrase [Candidatus Poribacteria bacterium]
MSWPITSSMKPKNDIYGHNKRLEQLKARVQREAISEANKELIIQFDKNCFMEALSKSRRIKIITILLILARDYLKKDFNKATKDDLKNVVMKIDSREDCSPWTKHSYKIILKKFYKWQVFGDEYRNKMEYPKIISWMRCTLKKKDQPKIKASDILTEVEINKLIDSSEHLRDKAFISMLYELGARIGEIGGLSIKEVTKDKYGYLVDLEGKTGHRTPRIVVSDAYLTHWLNSHPLKDKPDAPLWIMMGNRNKGKRMEYSAFRALVLRIVVKAEIKKRVYPHLFRHTRVTHLLVNKQINEAQAKVYFGWVPSSSMLSEYSHLISSDVNEAILEMHGIKTDKKKESLLKPKQCPRCSTINSKDARFCHKCGSILDVNTAIELEDERSKGDDLLADLLKNPKIQRLLAKEIIDMGLKKKLIKTVNKSRI